MLFVATRESAILGGLSATGLAGRSAKWGPLRAPAAARRWCMPSLAKFLAAVPLDRPAAGFWAYAGFWALPFLGGRLVLFSFFLLLLTRYVYKCLFSCLLLSLNFLFFNMCARINIVILLNCIFDIFGCSNFSYMIAVIFRIFIINITLFIAMILKLPQPF